MANEPILDIAADPGLRPAPADGSAGPEPPGPILQTLGLSKSFGATQALRDCSLGIRAGEVHAILGENGSGKSTLVKLLSGVQRPDRGSITLRGASSQGFPSPAAASAAGVVAVFQEVLVAGPCSVLDNVWMGTDRLWRDGVPRDEREDRARETLTALLGDSPALDIPIEELALSDRQACCIARALVRRPPVLILDEATSALDIVTRDRLFTILRRLRSEGAAVIFISHRMDEIAEIGDRITVMRAGGVVATRERGEASAQELIALMTGEQAARAAEQSTRVRGDVVLRATGVQLHPERPALDFELCAGELVGLAGLEGHGQNEFLRRLWGGEGLGGQIIRVTDGGQAAISSPRRAAREGIAFVPRERRNEALLTNMSIRANFALPTIGSDRIGARVSAGRSRRRLAGYVERLRITLANPDDAIETLSGGNQQKVVMARWLAAGPRVLLLNDPTRGVDAGAKRDLYDLLEELAADGLAVVMLSTEVDEHIALMDRVLVFRDHGLAAEIPKDRLSRRALISSFFGTQDTASGEEIHV